MHYADVIFLCETWLDKYETGEHYRIPNYDLFLNSAGNGKGIAVYIKNDKMNYRGGYCAEDLQISIVENENLQIVCVYRSQRNHSLEEIIVERLNSKPPRQPILMNRKDVSISLDLIELARFAGMLRVNEGSVTPFQASITDKPLCEPILMNRKDVTISLDLKCIGKIRKHVTNMLRAHFFVRRKNYNACQSR